MSLGMIEKLIKKSQYEVAKEAYKSQLRNHFSNKLERNNTNEKAILKHWGFAYKYTHDVIQSRWHDFESMMLATEPKPDPIRARAAFNYATYIIEDRFPEIEKHVVTDATAAVDYAKLVLGRAWNSDDEYGDIANRTISKHPTALKTYEMEVSQGRAMMPGM